MAASVYSALGPLQHRIARLIWRSGTVDGLRVNEIHSLLYEDCRTRGTQAPGYATVLGALKNLEKNGRVRHLTDPGGKRFHRFLPVGTEDEYNAELLASVLAECYDGDTKRLVRALP